MDTHDKIEFIIPTYNRTKHLTALLASLTAQTSPDWKAHIIADHPEQDVVDEINRILTFFNDDRFKLTVLDVRHNDWGHTPRNIGLDLSEEKWLVMTGEDNYYVPTFVENMLNETMDPQANFVFCCFLHNQAQMGNSYYPIKADIKEGKIDIGCYIFKKDFLNGIRLRTDLPEADYYFAIDYINKSPYNHRIYVDEVLYVHN